MEIKSAIANCDIYGEDEILSAPLWRPAPTFWSIALVDFTNTLIYNHVTSYLVNKETHTNTHTLLTHRSAFWPMIYSFPLYAPSANISETEFLLFYISCFCVTDDLLDVLDSVRATGLQNSCRKT